MHLFFIFLFFVEIICAGMRVCGIYELENQESIILLMTTRLLLQYQ